MRVLAIDTSTSDLVTGLVDVQDSAAAEGGAGVSAVVDRVLVDTRAHNELLIPTVNELLDAAGCTFADLDAIVVGCGPGPFTGLRVGMATAQALGVALRIPVHGVCSHDAIAAGVDAAAGPWLIATDARRKEVYWAAYDGATRTAGPAVNKPEQLDQHAPEGIARVVIPAAIAARLPQSLAQLPAEQASPRAAGLVAVAAASGVLGGPAGPLVPLYLRRPDAVPPQEKPRSKALTDIPEEFVGGQASQ